MAGDICEIVVGHADHYLARSHYQVRILHFLQRSVLARIIPQESRLCQAQPGGQFNGRFFKMGTL